MPWKGIVASCLSSSDPLKNPAQDIDDDDDDDEEDGEDAAWPAMSPMFVPALAPINCRDLLVTRTGILTSVGTARDASHE